MWIYENQYCIFKKGSCPPGFYWIKVYQNALKAWSVGGRYSRFGSFGDSKLDVHIAAHNDVELMFAASETMQVSPFCHGAVSKTLC